MWDKFVKFLKNWSQPKLVPSTTVPIVVPSTTDIGELQVELQQPTITTNVYTVDADDVKNMDDGIDWWVSEPKPEEPKKVQKPRKPRNRTRLRSPEPPKRKRTKMDRQVIHEPEPVKPAPEPPKRKRVRKIK